MIEKLKQINFPTSATFDNKKVAVFITAFNRPLNLEKVIKSMNLSDELEQIPIFAYLDGGHNSKQQENLEAIKKLKFKNKYIIKRSVNYGCDRNTFEMFNDMFVHLGFEYAFHVEDDFVFCKNYFKWCYEQFLNVKNTIDPSIGAFQGFNTCFLTPEQKKECLSNVFHTENIHLWGTLYSKESFLSIKNALQEYENIVQKFPTNGFSKQYMIQIANKDIKDCFVKIIDNCNLELSQYIKKSFYSKDDRHITLGWDGAFTLGMAVSGIKRYCSEVNRMINIGDVGHHYSRAAFESMNLHKITLDEVW